MTTIAERVAKGAAFLDENDPEWWRAGVDRAIDLATLNLGNGNTCILGQRCPLELIAAAARDDDGLIGTPYTWWSQALSGCDDWIGADAWAGERGFQLTDDDPQVPGNYDEYDALTGEWTRVITERRSAS